MEAHGAASKIRTATPNKVRTGRRKEQKRRVKRGGRSIMFNNTWFVLIARRASSVVKMHHPLLQALKLLIWTRSPPLILECERTDGQRRRGRGMC